MESPLDVLGLVAVISRRQQVPPCSCAFFYGFFLLAQKYEREPDMLTVCWSLMYLSESDWTPAKDVANVMLWELSWWLHHHDDISWTQFAEAMDSLACMLDNEGVHWHAATLRLTLQRLSDMNDIVKGTVTHAVKT